MTYLYYLKKLLYGALFLLCVCLIAVGVSALVITELCFEASRWLLQGYMEQQKRQRHASTLLLSRQWFNGTRK